MALVKAFNPLKKLEVVLVFHAHQAVHRRDFVDIFLLQHRLQYLEVFEYVVAKLGVRNNFFQVDGVWKQRFHHHAIRSTITALLHFGIPDAKHQTTAQRSVMLHSLQPREIVEPLQAIAAPDKVRALVQPDSAHEKRGRVAMVVADAA